MDMLKQKYFSCYRGRFYAISFIFLQSIYQFDDSEREESSRVPTSEDLNLLLDCDVPSGSAVNCMCVIGSIPSMHNLTLLLLA